jgi:hypothetical protein
MKNRFPLLEWRFNGRLKLNHGMIDKTCQN